LAASRTFHIRTFREQAAASNYAAKTECKVCFARMSGHRETQLPSPKSADVEKVFFDERTIFFGTASCVVHAAT
jgi:hypothetical protein